MTPVNVVVVFYSRYGETEKLALAAGVGAIQAHANIRLRRLPDLASSATIHADPLWSENLERMQKDYIAPREIDAEWADVLILAAPPDRTQEMKRYLASAKLAGKTAGLIGTFAEAAESAGLAVVSPERDPVNTASSLTYGRKTAEFVRSKKASGIHPV